MGISKSCQNRVPGFEVQEGHQNPMHRREAEEWYAPIFCTVSVSSSPSFRDAAALGFRFKMTVNHRYFPASS
jgi:hypothetical protein